MNLSPEQAKCPTEALGPLFSSAKCLESRERKGTQGADGAGMKTIISALLLASLSTVALADAPKTDKAPSKMDKAPAKTETAPKADAPKATEAPKTDAKATDKADAKKDAKKDVKAPATK